VGSIWEASKRVESAFASPNTPGSKKVAGETPREALIPLQPASIIAKTAKAAHWTIMIFDFTHEV
jgi:hypothetical protein